MGKEQKSLRMIWKILLMLIIKVAIFFREIRLTQHWDSWGWQSRSCLCGGSEDFSRIWLLMHVLEGSLSPPNVSFSRNFKNIELAEVASIARVIKRLASIPPTSADLTLAECALRTQHARCTHHMLCAQHKAGSRLKTGRLDLLCWVMCFVLTSDHALGAGCKILVASLAPKQWGEEVHPEKCQGTVSCACFLWWKLSWSTSWWTCSCARPKALTPIESGLKYSACHADSEYIQS